MPAPTTTMDFLLTTRPLPGSTVPLNSIANSDTLAARVCPAFEMAVAPLDGVYARRHHDSRHGMAIGRHIEAERQRLGRIFDFERAAFAAEVRQRDGFLSIEVPSPASRPAP